MIVYIWPIYISEHLVKSGSEGGKIAKEEEKPGITLQDVRHEERKDAFPWL